MPINLMRLYGERFRITFDEAYSTFKVPKAKRDPWMMQIPCKFGTIYPYSDELLAIDVDNHPVAAKAVAAVDDALWHQDGDREKTFLFPLESFEAVAAIVRPRKRRRLTEGQKAKLAASGNLFRPGHRASK